MAVSVWLIWKIDKKIFSKISIRIYLVKMFCNGLWSYVFFGLHETGWAFVIIIVLLILITWVTILFYKERKIAGILLFPYAIWVGFASILNLNIWLLN
jgi:tryptophan-rich sensory protein